MTFITKNIRVLICLFLSICFFFNTLYAQENDIVLIGNPIQGHLIIGNAINASSVFLNNEPLLLSEEGVFVFGFDRDDTGKFTVKVIFSDGVTKEKELYVSNRAYDIQRINQLEEKYVSPPPELMERINRERDTILEARKSIDTTQTPYYLSGFLRPVEGGRISGVFGGQRILNGEPKSPHNGIDIALPTGTPVYAMTDGIVCLRADNFHYNGNFILLDHGQGLNSVYVHLNKILVEDGQKVFKGQLIGEVGSTGRSTGPHLHWGVQWYKKRIDPQALLDMNF
ncbi:MAG: M23 family metallopeptidase [Bacteroidales bacterium]|nr:M23 family metallopeptidase [Bacteroidales bacterium]